jgi:hypothetical protein
MPNSRSCAIDDGEKDPSVRGAEDTTAVKRT